MMTSMLSLLSFHQVQGLELGSCSTGANTNRILTKVMIVLVCVPKNFAMVYIVVNPSSPLQELAHPACVAGHIKGSLAEE